MNTNSSPGSNVTSNSSDTKYNDFIVKAFIISAFVWGIAAIENKPFNKYHNEKRADFYLFECENDMEAATALFKSVFEWAKKRGLDTVIGPKGMGPLEQLLLIFETLNFKFSTRHHPL